jgi:hypothetical protein
MKFLKAEPVEFFVSVSGYLVFKNYTITILLTPEQSFAKTTSRLN